MRDLAPKSRLLEMRSCHDRIESFSRVKGKFISSVRISPCLACSFELYFASTGKDLVTMIV